MSVWFWTIQAAWILLLLAAIALTARRTRERALDAEAALYLKLVKRDDIAYQKALADAKQDALQEVGDFTVAVNKAYSDLKARLAESKTVRLALADARELVRSVGRVPSPGAAQAIAKMEEAFGKASLGTERLDG